MIIKQFMIINPLETVLKSKWEFTTIDYKLSTNQPSHELMEAIFNPLGHKKAIVMNV